ncbi:hypothetical protein ACO0LV_01900 [Pseudactinotalea sp. Z1739]|uniref:hypothetical protein n=1 Tax=Pseudactinotalea sp. Z1739 TaxID=3413028 RepID=UPI003C7A67D2
MNNRTLGHPTWGPPPATDPPTWAHRVSEWDTDIDGTENRIIDGAEQILRTSYPSDTGEIAVTPGRYQKRDPRGRITNEGTVLVADLDQDVALLTLAPATARHLGAMLVHAAGQIAEVGR